MTHSPYLADGPRGRTDGLARRSRTNQISLCVGLPLLCARESESLLIERERERKETVKEGGKEGREEREKKMIGKEKEENDRERELRSGKGKGKGERGREAGKEEGGEGGRGSGTPTSPAGSKRVLCAGLSIAPSPLPALLMPLLMPPNHSHSFDYSPSLVASCLLCGSQTHFIYLCMSLQNLFGGKGAFADGKGSSFRAAVEGCPGTVIAALRMSKSPYVVRCMLTIILCGLMRIAMLLGFLSFFFF